MTSDITSPCTACDAARDGRCYVEKNWPQPATEYRADGVAVMHIVIAEVGTLSPQHSHACEHLTMLTAGSVRVWRSDSDSAVYSAPAGIVIPAGTRHLFEALSPDVTLLCVHKIAREGRVEAAEEFQIEGAT